MTKQSYHFSHLRSVRLLRAVYPALVAGLAMTASVTFYETIKIVSNGTERHFKKEIGIMRLMAVIIFLVTAACTTSHQAGGSPEASSSNFSIKYPDEWKRLNTERYFILTKSGPFSQYILAQQRPVSKPFKHSNRTLEKEMLPLDAAKTILDEIQKDESISDFMVVDVRPAKVSEYDGFRMVFTYKTKKGYKFKTMYYGFLAGEWLYNLRYNAAEASFLDKDVETFHAVLKSFKIN
ncbi:MAG: hypothetical protein ABII06_05390 [Pseudomonadota bacterium]